MKTDPEWMQDQQEPDLLVIQVRALLLDPIGVLRRRWIWAGLALIVGIGATTAFLLHWKPVFESTATVVVSSQQIPEEFVRSTVSGLDSLANVNALIGEVVSQRSLSDLIDKYDLFRESSSVRPRLELIILLRKAITIAHQDRVVASNRNETSSIYSISYRDNDPAVAADVANELAGRFINASTERRGEQARLTTEFLQRELTRAAADLQEANREIADFQHKHRGEMPSDQEPNLRKLERLEIQRQTISAQLAAAEARLTNLENDAHTLSNPQRTLMELRMQLASELAVHTDEHPNVVALRRRIERVDSEVNDVRKLLEQAQLPEQDRTSSTRRELESLRTRLAETDSEATKLDAQTSRIPDNLEPLDALEKRAAVMRENYLEFLRKVQAAELAQTLESAQQGPRIAILDRAAVPTWPLRSRVMSVQIGILASVLLAIAVSVGLELIDPVVVDAQQLESIGDPPLLGSMHEF